MTWAEKMLLWRRKHGLTQDKTAALIGMSLRWYVQLERGRAQPTKSTVLAYEWACLEYEIGPDAAAALLRRSKEILFARRAAAGDLSSVELAELAARLGIARS